jgi:hypothetical protein
MNGPTTPTTTTRTPAAARTDAPSLVRPGTEHRSVVRRTGLALATGAALWSAVSFAYGFEPDTEAGVKITDLGGLAFQTGAFALVGLQLRTRATGTSRKAVGMLKVERVLLAVAMAWSVLHAFLPGQRGTIWLGVLDAFWPLSMLGMAIIGVKVALAGRWRGPARFWPLVAESWAPVTIPIMGIFGDTAGLVAGAGHLLVGYTVLGLLLAARPDLLPRD